MAKFRKKPVVIEAVRYDGTGAALKCVRSIAGDDKVVDVSLDNELLIQTLEGCMTARVGDWIIRGVRGELYPCKPDIFEETYELVEE